MYFHVSRVVTVAPVALSTEAVGPFTYLTDAATVPGATGLPVCITPLAKWFQKRRWVL